MKHTIQLTTDEKENVEKALRALRASFNIYFTDWSHLLDFKSVKGKEREELKETAERLKKEIKKIDELLENIDKQTKNQK